MLVTTHIQSIIGGALLCLMTYAPIAFSDSNLDPNQSENWPYIKQQLFPDNPMIHQDDLLQLTTPTRAEDAAIVPVSISTNLLQSSSNYIERIWLVVDNNPSPIVGVFDMTRNNGLASISTRIRVNAYSPVRAIALTKDGVFHMAANFVKASGGCSAPAVSNDSDADQRRGKMKLRQKPELRLTRTQLLISHPNHSGLQKDQLSHLWIPADFVNSIQVTLNGEPVMSFKGGISMSENPSIQFYVDAEKDDVLLADVTDSEGRAFSSSWTIE